MFIDMNCGADLMAVAGEDDHFGREARWVDGIRGNGLGVCVLMHATPAPPIARIYAIFPLSKLQPVVRKPVRASGMVKG